VTRAWFPAALCLLSVLYAWSARGFESGFIADPVGPRAFPYAIGVCLAVTAAVLVFQTLGEGKREREPAPNALGRHAVFVASLVVYANALDVVGYIPGTTALATVTVFLFRGPLGRGLAVSLVVSILIFAVFVLVLRVPLPGA